MSPGMALGMTAYYLLGASVFVFVDRRFSIDPDGPAWRPVVLAIGVVFWALLWTGGALAVVTELGWEP